MGFTGVDGVNWFPGGSDLEGIYPKPVEYVPSIFWRTAIKLSKLQYMIKEYLMQKLPGGVLLRPMENGDIETVCKLINSNTGVEFRPHYNPDEYQSIVKNNNIHGVIAEKGGSIIGVLTYVVSAWSGWMYGKPQYDDKWGIFYAYTPDDFVVVSEYQNTSVPARMILELMRTKDPEKKIKNKDDYSLIVDVFDRRIEWRLDALLKAGCSEPKFDYGVILGKALRGGIKLDRSKPWDLPARGIIAPVSRLSN